VAVYSYIRVSTARQASEGESLDVQQRTITGYAMMHGLSDGPGLRGAWRLRFGVSDRPAAG
jgi:hypothetical protein